MAPSFLVTLCFLVRSGTGISLGSNVLQRGSARREPVSVSQREAQLTKPALHFGEMDVEMNEYTIDIRKRGAIEEKKKGVLLPAVTPGLGISKAVGSQKS